MSFVVYIVANRFDRILRKITDLALRSIMRVRSSREYSLCSSTPLCLGQCIAVHHRVTVSRKQLVGFSRMDGMKIKNVDRLCELCDSVVNNRIYLIKRSSNHRAIVES